MTDIRRQDWVEASNHSPDDFDRDEALSPSQQPPPSAPKAKTRSAEQVIDAHLRACKQRSIEDDLGNFDPSVVILSRTQVYRGHDGVRQFWRDFADEVPAAQLSFAAPRSGGDAAMIEWQARGDHAYVEDGVDSYVVRDGRIVVQTVHYTVRRPM